MKGVKWWILLLGALFLLVLISCGPTYSTISSLAHHVVEVTANDNDSDLKDLASWCDTKNILMLWYELDNQPQGFNDRNAVFSGAAADKNVYTDNQFIANYGTTSLNGVETAINNYVSNNNLSGSLILLLRAQDLLGTVYDLIIGEDGQTKAAITNYVLVEFEEIDSTNHLYKVSKVRVDQDWKNFTVPKNISVTDLANKGFAFFRIDDDKVVDARVIYP
ncbi:hypothetical protein [Pseudothermotoga elfii]|jgi:hypothetical protein|uniref:hypothetical protein n=1 Tax=Pseudothermotoga elfii TaxID=38322 RepID=UPI0003F628AD|nr:hypothetical protein [Pseudothermotoga elfii]